MLKHTLILPDKAADGALAVQLLGDAINSLDVVLMLVLGKGKSIGDIVDWADQLCAKTQVQGGNLRRVVWIREPAVAQVDAVLTPILGKKRPIVAVLDFHDQLKKSLDQLADIDPIELELAFLEGHST